MPSQNTQNTPFTALAYYQEAMQHLHEERLTDALNNIDMAISLSTDKSLYVFYKIHILYLAKLRPQCASLILSHLSFLYTHCTLNQFAQILTYYQEFCGCTTEDLANTLSLHNIPTILSFEYPNLIDATEYNFHIKALEYEESGDLEGCISCCSLALKFEPNSLSLLHLQASCYMALKNYTHAILIYEQLLSIQSITSEISYPLALAYMQVDNLTQAISYFKQLLHEIPRHTDGLLNLSECYIKLTTYEKAIPCLEKLIRLEPLDSTYPLRLGEVYNLLNRKHQAQKYYKLAHELQEEKGDAFPTSIKPIKHVKWLSLGAILILLSISQFYLFKTGILPSLIYNVSVTVDSPIIPVNGFTDFKINYKQFPFYAKDANYEVVSANKDIANVIEGLSSLNGFSIGKVTFNVNLNGVTQTTFNVEVRQSLPTAIHLEPVITQLVVGETTSLTSIIIYEDNLPGTLEATFTSTNPSTLSISSSGDVIQALSPGKATIIAACGNISTSLDIEVILP